MNLQGHQNDPKNTQNDPKRSPRRQKKQPRSTRGHQDVPPWPQEVQKGGGTPSLHSPCGGHLGTKNEIQTDPKTVEKRSDESKAKKNDPRRSRIPLGALLATFRGHAEAKNHQKPLENVVFREKSLFRQKVVSKTASGPT